MVPGRINWRNLICDDYSTHSPILLQFKLLLLLIVRKMFVDSLADDIWLGRDDKVEQHLLAFLLELPDLVSGVLAEDLKLHQAVSLHRNR